MRTVIVCIWLAASGWAQEAASGLEVRANISTAAIVSSQLDDPPRSGAPVTAGLRAMVYPTWKLNGSWAISGAVQIHTRPYFTEEFLTQGKGVRSDVLQLHLSYSRFWKNNSVVIRAGQLSSAFGSFLLRYDDADNPLVDMPLTYGYYYKPITTYALTGAQADVTIGRVDLRVQLANSSPTNRRSLFDSDQYGNWASGVGYTVFQGLRIGASGFRGPYLHRQHPYYFAGEAPPRELAASAVGVEAEWVRGYWSARGEVQRFRLPYRAIPTYTQKAWYAEARRMLHPRLYVAMRTGYLGASVGGDCRAHEFAAGFRPNRHQLIKIGYQVPQQHGGRIGKTFTVQVVTTLRPFSWARNQ
jgi:hypothetical protein